MIDISSNGTIRYFAPSLDNCTWFVLHRPHGKPAYLLIDGSEEYYVDGDLHRDNDLPALIWTFEPAYSTPQH